MRRISSLLFGCCLVLLLASSASSTVPGPINLAAGRPVTASSSYLADTPALAVDADSVGTAWNAGGTGPSWIEIDLGSDINVGSVVGDDAAVPTSTFTHTVTGRTSGGTTYTLGGFSGTVVNHQMLRIACTSAVPPVRYVRITTTSSASWVAWWDIRIYEGTGSTATQNATWGRIKSLYR